MDMPSGADQIPNIILPRKAVAEIRKMIGEDEGEVVVSLSETRAAFSFGDVKLTQS